MSSRQYAAIGRRKQARANDAEALHIAHAAKAAAEALDLECTRIEPDAESANTEAK